MKTTKREFIAMCKDTRRLIHVESPHLIFTASIVVFSCTAISLKASRLSMHNKAMSIACVLIDFSFRAQVPVISRFLSYAAKIILVDLQRILEQVWHELLHQNQRFFYCCKSLQVNFNEIPQKSLLALFVLITFQFSLTENQILSL